MSAFCIEGSHVQGADLDLWSGRLRINQRADRIGDGLRLGVQMPLALFVCFDARNHGARIGMSPDIPEENFEEQAINAHSRHLLLLGDMGVRIPAFANKISGSHPNLFHFRHGGILMGTWSKFTVADLTAQISVEGRIQDSFPVAYVAAGMPGDMTVFLSGREPATFYFSPDAQAFGALFGATPCASPDTSGMTVIVRGKR